MTVEEIEIIVTARVKEAMKEFDKIAPKITEAMKKVQETFSNFDNKEFNQKVKQATTLAKKQVDNLRKSTANNEIKLKMNNDEVKKAVSQTKKELDSLKAQTTSRKYGYNRYKRL